MRLKRKSYPASPTVGHRASSSVRGKLNGKTLLLIHNLAELKSLNKSSVAILAKIGAKKKLEIIKYAEENKIQIANLPGGKTK